MSTLDYYNNNAKGYFEKTVTADFAEIRAVFLSYAKVDARILDFGCGSGRDTKAFAEAGYRVDAIDGSPELCKIATEYSGVNVKEMLFSDFKAIEKYDAVWACASILHLPYDDIKAVMRNIYNALAEGGIFYTTFKYGTFEGTRDGRYYTDFDEEKLGSLLDELGLFTAEKMWTTQDVIAGRETQVWVNVILRKRTTRWEELKRK